MKKIYLSTALCLALAAGSITPVLAAPKPSPEPQPQHHRLLKKVAAGVIAYKIAKKTGDNRVAHGGKRNFLQRHPILTGLGAAHFVGRKKDHPHIHH